MRVFVRTMETGSFSQAASQLALPRSTVSKLINELEKHLGIKLMHRTTRSVAATSEGLEYYHRAQRLIADLDDLDTAVGSKKLNPSGHLRVNAPTSFANYLLIPALPDFHRQYSNITIALGISDRVLNLVEEGVDCSIRAGDLADTTMIGRKICELAFATCASPAYLERLGQPDSPADVQANHMQAGFFFTPTGKSHSLIFDNGVEHVEINNSQFSVNEGNGLIRLMLAGLGIGQHPRRFMQPYLDSGELVEVLTDWSRPALPFHILYPPNRHPNARLKMFIDWMIDTFREDRVTNRQPS